MATSAPAPAKALARCWPMPPLPPNTSAAPSGNWVEVISGAHEKSGGIEVAAGRRTLGVQRAHAQHGPRRGLRIAHLDFGHVPGRAGLLQRAGERAQLLDQALALVELRAHR